RTPKEPDGRGGAVGAGSAAGAGGLARHLPVSALNVIVTAPGELWALRYPDQHALHILDRPGGGELHVRSATSSVHAPSLDRTASVVVASEELDGESGWRILEPGELAHGGPGVSARTGVGVSWERRRCGWEGG